jgi:DEAD/DEAH box helicase domain-containing protein
VATIALMCDPRDLGQTIEDAQAARVPVAERESRGLYEPTAFLFDNVPGGVGLSERIYEQRDELLARTRQLIAGCRCDEAGCPLCVGATESIDAKRKRASLGLLAILLHQA